MTRLLAASLIAAALSAGSCGGTATVLPDLLTAVIPHDLAVTPDLATPVDLTTPPDLTPTPDLASVLDLSGKIFLSGGTFAGAPPAMASVSLPMVGKGNYPNVVPPAGLFVELKIGPLYATYVPNGPAFGATLFKIYCDAMGDFGQATQLELVYDFKGDGSSVRTDFYNDFPTDNVNGWEFYTEAKGLWSSKGGYDNFANGYLTARLWKPFQPTNTSNSAYQEGTSYLLLPYK